MTSKVDSETPSLWRIRDLIENPQAVMHALHSIGLPPDRVGGVEGQREPLSAAARAVEASSQFIAGKVEMISDAARALLALDSSSPGDDTSDGSAVVDVAKSAKSGTKYDAAKNGDDEGNIHAFWIPGRIELAGKHTDYAGGRSLLVAIPKGFVAIARARLGRTDADADIDAEGGDESAYFDESASRKRRKTTGDKHVDSSDECARAAGVSNWCRVVTLDPSVSVGDRVVHVRLDGGDTDGYGEEQIEEGHWSHYVKVAIRRISRNYREIASAATKAMTSSSISSSSFGASSSGNVKDSVPLPRLHGIDLVIGCDIPIAAGMSTSSALICCVFMALDAVNDHKIRKALRLALHLPRREVNREGRGEREAATVAPAVKASTGCDQEYWVASRQDSKDSGEGEKEEDEDWEEEFDGEEDDNDVFSGKQGRGSHRAGSETASWSTDSAATTTTDHIEGSTTRPCDESSHDPSPSVEDCALFEYLGCVENGKPYDTAMGAAAAPTLAEVEEASKFVDFREIIDKMSSEALQSYDFDGWEPLQRRRRRRERQWLESGLGLVLSGDGGVGTFGGSEDHTAIMACRAGRASIFRFCPTVYESSFTFPSHRFSLVVASSGVSAQKSKGETKVNYNKASEAAKAAAEALNCATLGECLALGMATCDKGGHSEKRSDHTKSGSSSSSRRRSKNADVGVPCLLGGLMACMDRLDWIYGKKNCVPKEEKVGVFNLINCRSFAECYPKHSSEQVDETSQTGAFSSIRSRERNDVAMAHLRRLVQFTFESEVVVPKLALAIEKCDKWNIARYSGTSQSCSDEILGNIVDETRWLPESALAIGEEMYFTSNAGASGSFSWPRRWIDEDSPFVVKERPFINVCCGASAFGAGFGGSVWALVDSNVAHEFAARWRQAYLATFDPEVADANGDSEQVQDRRYTESSIGSSTNMSTKTGTDSKSGISLASSCNFFVVPTASPGACTIFKVR